MTETPPDNSPVKLRKKFRIRQLVINLLALLLVLLVVRWFMQRDVISGPAPVLTGINIMNMQPINTANWRGEPYLIHIWASWCRICRLEEDSINRINENNRVITIAMQSGDDEDVSDYLKQRGYSWLVLNDEDGSLSSQFRIRGVPASFIVDQDGVIRFSEVGYTSGWGLRLRLWMAGLWLW
ncbi:MAG TPA: protein disulfide oxidoreductase [Gammaproteobacteria bacterium]|nr:protein disulfide oxidoreductase [Gammaproteobacteria bacterium]